MSGHRAPGAVEVVAGVVWGVAVHVVVTLAVFDPAPFSGGDNAAYLGLARSLLDQGTYRELWDPAQRLHTQYPPGFPLLLALGLAAGLPVWIGLKGLVLALSALAVAVSYRWLRTQTSGLTALLATTLLAIAPGVARLSQLELSDVPFWAMSILALWALELAPGRLRGTVIAGLATAAAVLIRSAGLPLALGLAAYVLLKRPRREGLLFLALTLPPILGWWAWQRFAGDASAYTDAFAWKNPYQPELGKLSVLDLGERWLENVRAYSRWRLPSLLFGVRESVLLGGSLLALSFFGWLRKLRDFGGPGPAELAWPLLWLTVLSWPSQWSDERFLLPLLPLLLYYGVRALELPGGRSAAPFLLSLGVVGALPGLLTTARAAATCRSRFQAGDVFGCYPEAWREGLALAAHLKNRLSSTAVLLARKPTLVWAFSGYPSRVFPFSSDPRVFEAAARDIGATHLLLDGSSEVARYLRPIIETAPELFCPIPEWSSPSAALVRLRHEGDACPGESRDAR